MGDEAVQDAIIRHNCGLTLNTLKVKRMQPYNLFEPHKVHGHCMRAEPLHQALHTTKQTMTASTNKQGPETVNLSGNERWRALCAG